MSLMLSKHDVGNCIKLFTYFETGYVSLAIVWCLCVTTHCYDFFAI